MHVSAFLPQSALDYPDKICALVFVSPCNFRCGYCHNPTLVEGTAKEISESEVLDTIKTQSGFIDAVTITGGEPTLQPDLIDFCKKLKAMGVSVKVDTNGSHPEVLESLIIQGAVDYIAMDLKCNLRMYKMAVNATVDQDAIRHSISLILENRVPYEFRTTVVPHLITGVRLEEMAMMVKGARLYALQQFHNVVVLDKAYQYFEPYSREKLELFKEIVDKYVQKSEIRA